MILGETLRLREQISATDNFTIDDATIDIYDASGEKVIDDASCTIDNSDLNDQILSYDFTPSATGHYLGVFKAVIGSQTRYFEQGVYVDAPANLSVVNYLRNLLDDENPSSYYWPDEQIQMYLRRWRRSVVVDAYSDSDASLSFTGISTYASGVAYSMRSSLSDRALIPAPDRKTFRSAPHLRFWATDTTPQIFVDGRLVTGNSDWAYSVDEIAGSVTFSEVDGVADAPIPAYYGVQAAFDYWPLYELAHEALTVAMGQWASVQEIQTPTQRMRRETIRGAMQRVEALRRHGYAPSIVRPLAR